MNATLTIDPSDVFLGSKVQLVCPHGKFHKVVISEIYPDGSFLSKLIDQRTLCHVCKREDQEASEEKALSE